MAKHRRDLLTLQSPRDRVARALNQLHENARQIDYAELSFAQSCLLYTVLVAADMEPGNRIIPPLEEQTHELAPTSELSSGIYARLYTDGILLPAISSDLNAFSVDEETGGMTFSVWITAWTLAKDVSGRSIDEIFSVLFRRLEQPEPKEVESLWYLVAEDECRRYFMSQWERYRFTHAGIYSTKIASALRQYMDQCSIGQMWNIIYYAVKNLAALTQEGKHTPQHIYNMLPGSIRRYADYRLANDQSIRPWRRAHPTAESWITSILLDKVLKAGDISFEMLKGKDVIRYVEHLIIKPERTVAATWFLSPQPDRDL